MWRGASVAVGGLWWGQYVVDRPWGGALVAGAGFVCGASVGDVAAAGHRESPEADWPGETFVARVEFMSAPVGGSVPVDQISTGELSAPPDLPYLPPSSLN